MGIDERAKALLGQPIDPKIVKSRPVGSGRKADYIAGYSAINQANRLFGYDGWGYEIVELSIGATAVIARVRVTVVGAPSREDVGVEAAKISTKTREYIPLEGDALDMAVKAAVTDGLKRGLRSFGAQFGNSLYGEDVYSSDAPDTPTNRTRGTQRASGGSGGRNGTRRQGKAQSRPENARSFTPTEVEMVDVPMPPWAEPA